MKKFYIGLSVTYHDPALAIMDSQGNVLFSEATERYLQYKRALNCEPDSALNIGDLVNQYCDPPSAFIISFNWDKKRPFYEKFCRFANYFTPAGLMRPRFEKASTFLKKYQLFHMLACQTRSMAGGGINLANKLRHDFPDSPLTFRYYNHHLCHAAAACYSSFFTDAVCIVVDSYGERGSLALYHFRDEKLQLIKELSGIESLGFFYMKITELCGFDWLKGEEWKVMGLAGYGSLNQDILEIFQSMVWVDNLSCQQSLENIRTGIHTLQAGNWDRADLAYTGQYFFENLIEQLLNHLYRLELSDNLVLSGGCALNSSCNGQILEKTPFKNLYIPSAPADDGTALGASLLAFKEDNPQGKVEPRVASPYLGSKVSNNTLQRLLEHGNVFKTHHLPNTICEKTAELLSKGLIVGWVQGEAEFGPRALGNRSILADPRDSSMKDKINERVKFREEFRPFAPAILHEYGAEYFENYQPSRYMERTLRFKQAVREKVPAVVHVDGTGRLQTVKSEWNKKFYDLIDSFNRITKIPILLNTSFNIMGKPIIHTVEDAVSVFLTTGIDALVIEDYLFLKEKNG